MPQTATRTAGTETRTAESWCATLNSTDVMRRGEPIGIDTIVQLARKSGLSRRTLTEAINGGPVSLLTVSRVADAVMCSPADLIVWSRVR